MKKTFLIASFFVLLIVNQTSAQIFKVDSLAKAEEITLERNLGEITLYDYGQTTMKMKFYKYELPMGNLYGSLISLSTPTSKYNMYTDPATTIRLDLNETEEFINKLDALLEIDSKKDTKAHRDLQISSNKTISAGTTVWRSNKKYSYMVSNENGGLILFNLKTNYKGNNIDESDIEGIFLTDDSEVNYFTVNDYNEYRRRVKRALISFESVLQRVKNDENKITNENKLGLKTETLSYTPIIEEGYKVLKSNVHNTENLQLVADITLERTSRKIKISDYKGQFQSWEIVSDSQLNLYVKEIINYKTFIGDLLPLLEKHNAQGILNPEINKSNNSIIAHFSIFK